MSAPPSDTLAVAPFGEADTAPPSEPAARSVSVRRHVLALAWPAVLEQVLFTFVGLVDVFIVGHLGAAAITGVGLGGQVLFVAMTLFTGLGVGSTTLVARYTGAHEPEEVTRIAWQSLVVAVLAGVLVSVGTFIFAEPIIQLVGGNAEVVALGAQWLRVYALSVPLLAILFVGNAVLRGAGDTRTPLMVMGLVNLVNVVVAWVLVRELGVGVMGRPQAPRSGRASAAWRSRRCCGARCCAWRANGPASIGASGASSTSACRPASSRCCCRCAGQPGVIITHGYGRVRRT
jgi:Na+-driven multidrug efflux pump